MSDRDHGACCRLQAPGAPRTSPSSPFRQSRAPDRSGPAGCREKGLGESRVTITNRQHISSWKPPVGRDLEIRAARRGDLPGNCHRPARQAFPDAREPRALARRAAQPGRRGGRVYGQGRVHLGLRRTAVAEPAAADGFAGLDARAGRSADRRAGATSSVPPRRARQQGTLPLPPLRRATCRLRQPRAARRKVGRPPSWPARRRSTCAARTQDH